MSFNVAMLEAMQAEGLDLSACIRVLRAGEKGADTTAAERQRRCRARKVSRRDVTRDPPNDIDILTPEVSEANASSPQLRPWVLPVGVSLQVWNDLLANRKRKRLPNTETAWKKFQADLAEISAQTGIPPPKLVEQCTAKGWGAIYDPRDNRHERPQSPGIGSTERAMLSAIASIEGGGAGAGFRD